ncbi:MAG: serine hydrolase [Candidatus Aminicenantes bacterium]|nr:serine hydrolase [Candidatus Aminicenantes bacterium]
MPEWLKTKDAPGVAIAVVDDTTVVWQGVYGHTARDGDKPVTARTLFSIQSMSKSFTALGVLMAVQDGLLDLDAPITEYLPDFTVHSRFEDNPERRMTLRHLLCHRAGFTHEAPVGGNYDSRPTNFREHVLSFSDTWLRYPVGYRYSYSNIGIDLAGYILEKVSGRPFADYIRDKVLVPLGMTDSTLDLAAVLKMDDRARGHLGPRVRVPGGIPVEVPMVPAGGVYTNLLDMARYLAFHINEGRIDGRPVLRDDLTRAMHTVAFPEPGQEFGYGLGLAVDHYGPEVYYSHGGGGYGFGSYMVMFPGLKTGVIYMANSESGGQGIGWVSEVVFDLIAKTIGPPGPEFEKPTIETARPVLPEDARVQRLVGEYGGNVVVGPKDKAFGIELGKEFHPLAFYDDRGGIVGVFGKYSELRAKPRLAEQAGTLVHLNRLAGTVAYYDFHRSLPKEDEPGPDKPDWKPYLGTFRILYWGRTFGSLATVRINGGYLTYNGMRCREYLPGLFFAFDGEALDFRGTIATFRNIPLIRTGR